MGLEARIKKLATGLSARDAAGAFVRAGTTPVGGASDRGSAGDFEATVEAMFLMAAVDGEVSPEEIAQLTASVDAFAAVHGRAGVNAATIVSELNTKLDQDGWNQRLASVAARLIDPESRAFAFRLAAGVAFVDDHVAHAEAAALEALATAFALSADESQEILYDVRETLFG